MSSSSLWPQPKRQFSFLQYTKEERHQFSDPPTTFFLLQYVSILPSLPIPRKSHNIHTNMNKKTLDPVLRNSIQRQRERDRKREREREMWMRKGIPLKSSTSPKPQPKRGTLRLTLTLHFLSFPLVSSHIHPQKISTFSLLHFPFNKV